MMTSSETVTQDSRSVRLGLVGRLATVVGVGIVGLAVGFTMSLGQWGCAAFMAACLVGLIWLAGLDEAERRPHG